MKQHQKLVKYLHGSAQALERLAVEISARGEFDKDDEELLSKIGSNLLFHAKSYGYLADF